MRQGYICWSLAVCGALCSLVPVTGIEPSADVPFELVQQHLIVAKGSIAGLHGLNLLIDTGTIPSVLDQRIAKKLQLRAVPSEVVAFGQTVRVRSASVSGLQIGLFQPGEVPVSIGDLSYLEGARIDAIVGLDVLARASFRIDYNARTLSFSASDSESFRTPLRVVWPFMTITLYAAGRPMHLLVDTGSRDLVLLKSRMPASLLPLPWKGDKVIRHASGLAHLLRYEFRQASLGDQQWDKLDAFVLDASTSGYPPGIDGVLGVRALGGARVRFNFERGELSWSK